MPFIKQESMKAHTILEHCHQLQRCEPDYPSRSLQHAEGMICVRNFH